MEACNHQFYFISFIILHVFSVDAQNFTEVGESVHRTNAIFCPLKEKIVCFFSKNTVDESIPPRCH